MTWIIEHWQMLASSLLVVINEVIAYNDGWKSNSILQLIVNLLKSIVKPQIPPAA